MLKIFLGTLAGVFVIVSAVVIFYWRDIQFEPGPQQLVLYFGLIPLGISLLLLSPVLMFRWYKYRQEKKQKQQLEAQNAEAETPEETQSGEPPEWVQLYVLSVSTVSSFGEGPAHLQALEHSPAAALDSQLVNEQNVQVVSYRIADLDDLAEAVEQGMNSRHKRIMALIQTQLEQHDTSLATIAAQLKQSALFYDGPLAQVYRMHPAWVDPEAETEAEQEAEPVAEPVARLTQLNIHIILAENLLQVWDEPFCSDQIQDHLTPLNIIHEQLQLQYHYWHKEAAYGEWLSLLKQIQHQSEQVSLMIVADSELDQGFMNQQSGMSVNHIPAEFAGACFLTGPAVQVGDLNAVRDVRIVLNEKEISDSLEALKINELTQYEDENPFVLILDDPSGIRMFRKLQQNFLTSPIEPHHYLYSQSGLGYTRHLSDLLGFMLGLQSDAEVAMIYSTKHAQTQVFVGAGFVS
ncbi:hypothetical protein [Acinetobacter sp. WZC-1]|uniref:hypothetical protein n=1 Tax=Acinetobacter sp. WZC-1 TaxID=3459034 RepID=UPI00403E0700